MVLKWILSLSSAEGWEAMSPTIFPAAYHGVKFLLTHVNFARKQALNNPVSFAGWRRARRESAQVFLSLLETLGSR